MIGTDHESLTGRHPSLNRRARLGGPLVTIGALIAVWVTGRAVLWENPFPHPAATEALQTLAESRESPRPSTNRAIGDFTDIHDRQGVFGNPPRSRPTQSALRGDQGPAPGFSSHEASMAADHFLLWQAALTSDGRGASWRSAREGYEVAQGTQLGTPVFPGQPPFVSEKHRRTRSRRADRWSLAAWVFAREGSVGSRIAPGPAPVYGASQTGANLHYRLAPGRAQDPRVYLRAARALIDQGETEVAAGISARPVGALPVRMAAEVRATDNALGSDLRPAAFAITELAPQSLPLEMAAEIYAAGGYVGGAADTPFAEGQATVTRSLASFDLRRVDDVRVSVGAGAWGGAQRGVHRVDVGPTLRVDLALGSVPARVSIDYRERVGGEATPASGVAATLSTQF